MYLGLDLGTSGLKALVVDAAGGVLAETRGGYAADRPGPGRSEQDPDIWIDACKRAVAEAREAVPALSRDLRAIGLAGQMHSLVALDGRDRPVRPAILWNDGRGAAWADAAPAETAAITGAAPMASFTAAKLHWLAGAEPATLAAIRRILLPKDYLRLWLTGDWATDPSDAAGTQLFDQARLDWSGDMAAAAGIDVAALPPILPSAGAAGRLRKEVAEALGLPAVEVVAGAADTPAGALATGPVEAGRTMISLGTGALCMSASERYAPPDAPGLHHFAHALPGFWYRMGAILNCGSAIDWLSGLLGRPAPELLAEIAERDWPGPGRVLALPYLDGARSPRPAPAGRGALLGLGPETDGADLMLAMLEGISLALHEAVAAMERGAPLGRPLVIGGGTRSELWLRILATVLGREIAVATDATGGTAMGAARLAMLGDGRPAAEVLRGPETRRVAPDEAARPACAAAVERFRAFWPLVADQSR